MIGSLVIGGSSLINSVRTAGAVTEAQQAALAAGMGPVSTETAAEVAATNSAGTNAGIERTFWTTLNRPGFPRHFRAD